MQRKAAVMALTGLAAGVLATSMVFGFFHHKQKEPPPARAAIVDPRVAAQVREAIDELKTIRTDYPWLKPWAQNTIELVNQILAEDDQNGNLDEDVNELGRQVWLLRGMEENGTI